MPDHPAGREGDPLARMTAELCSAGVFHCDTRLGHGISLALPAMPGTVMFHLVLEGSCTVVADDHEVPLGPGGVALLARGTGPS